MGFYNHHHNHHHSRVVELSINMEKASSHVLYVDHAGHVAPLTSCFYATASRHLSSCTENRHPPTTTTEIDSAYCPQCLSFHDAATAASIGYCPKSSCKQCPLCTSVASICILEGEKVAFYKCGFCSWTSKDCNLSVAVAPGQDGSIGKEQLEKAREGLGNALKERIAQQEKGAEQHYQNMLEGLEELARMEVKRAKGLGISSKTAPKRMNEPWSMTSLEESIKVKREKAMKRNIVGGKPPQVVSELQTWDESLKDVPLSSLVYQSVTTTAEPMSKKDLLPLSIPLRPRKSRRCRAELADGRPGILVKPKLNPLEGDTSLRSGHGQFWKKDSSAIHVIPRITIVQQVTTENKSHFLLKVTNPTLGSVRLRLGSSDYKGEPSWDGKERTPDLSNITVNTLTGDCLDASLIDASAATFGAADWAALEAVEDAFLDMGAKTEVPSDVQAWKESVAATSDVGVRLVASQADKAWFSLTAPIVEKTANAASHPAIPISLQIQVGEGTWESSLVKAADGKDPDVVTFDVVLVWKLQ